MLSMEEQWHVDNAQMDYLRRMRGSLRQLADEYHGGRIAHLSSELAKALDEEYAHLVRRWD